MSSLARAKHPKIILGAVGTAIAIPVLGITISFVSVSANAQQDPSVQQNASAQQEVNETVANVSTPVASPAITNSPPIEIADPKPAQSPLPDPLAPELSDSNSPAQEVVTAPTPEPIVEETPSAAPTPTVKTPTPTYVQAPRVVKKETDVVGSWTPPTLLNPGTVLLRAPQLSSGVKVSVTVACSPSVNCVIDGDQLTISDGAHVTVTYTAKATDTHTAWSTTISN